jgi:hypothetical protein
LAIIGRDSAGDEKSAVEEALEIQEVPFWWKLKHPTLADPGRSSSTRNR